HPLGRHLAGLEKEAADGADRRVVVVLHVSRDQVRCQHDVVVEEKQNVSGGRAGRLIARRLCVRWTLAHVVRAQPDRCTPKKRLRLLVRIVRLVDHEELVWKGVEREHGRERSPQRSRAIECRDDGGNGHAGYRIDSAAAGTWSSAPRTANVAGTLSTPAHW